MLTIKSTTPSSADPDSASVKSDSTQIIFIQDEPEPDQPPQNEPQPQIATRIQGGENVSIQNNPAERKEAQKDIPSPALSDDYKKGMQNQTKIEDQAPDGNVNILEDAIIAQEEQREAQIIPPAPIPSQSGQFKNTKIINQNNIKTVMQSEDKQNAPTEILNAFLQEKIQKSSEIAQETIEKTHDKLSKELPQPEIQKVISKKHRPADIGRENISKVQLSKQTQEIDVPKKKMSLLDLQSGFNQFLKKGNEEYYSIQGNAQSDDINGLKVASYNKQIGQMYRNANVTTPNLIHNKQYEKPTNNSVIRITIERSGNVSNLQIITSCGIEDFDRHHIRIIESIGNFPPIPKYIETPYQISATLQFIGDRSSASFIPIKIKR